MMTLAEFRTLANIYGSDLQRWPRDLRKNPQTLLEHSPEARAILAEAAELDEAIRHASASADEALWQNSTPDAALDRLRANVAAQIAARSFRRPSFFERLKIYADHMLLNGEAPLGWHGMVSSGSIAIVVGLIIGATYTAPQKSVDFLSAMLLSAPITILVDLT